MYGEIDLESYTLSIIRLNTAFQKLENSDSIQEVKTLLEESLDDLEKIYGNTVDDLNSDEVNINEYYMFFQNGRQAFPQYIEALGSIENSKLQEVVNSLLNVFTNLNKIAGGFSGGDMNET
ncbi:hypothetical protein [Methanobrevibacter sp.]|uniref:hypothetical protein n=1 Tax=Methanobrevibacter sp. TaxID=66852 RepID=UPI0038709DCE